MYIPCIISDIISIISTLDFMPPKSSRLSRVVSHEEWTSASWVVHENVLLFELDSPVNSPKAPPLPPIDPIKTSSLWKTGTISSRIEFRSNGVLSKFVSWFLFQKKLGGSFYLESGFSPKGEWVAPVNFHKVGRWSERKDTNEADFITCATPESIPWCNPWLC